MSNIEQNVSQLSDNFSRNDDKDCPPIKPNTEISIPQIPVKSIKNEKENKNKQIKKITENKS